MSFIDFIKTKISFSCVKPYYSFHQSRVFQELWRVWSKLSTEELFTHSSRVLNKVLVQLHIYAKECKVGNKGLSSKPSDSAVFALRVYYANLVHYPIGVLNLKVTSTYKGNLGKVGGVAGGRLLSVIGMIRYEGYSSNWKRLGAFGAFGKECMSELLCDFMFLYILFRETRPIFLLLYVRFQKKSTYSLLIKSYLSRLYLR